MSLDKNKILKFDLSNKNIKIKELLSGDFLALDVWAINNDYPNNNGSTFTVEGMREAIPTVSNKPVMGHFNYEDDKEGDFRAHDDNGIHYDDELQEYYLDYTKNSEVALGVIRESDNVTVEHDKKTDKYWMRISCVLWTKYHFKEIKSLLKKRNGSSKVSVEIEVLDSYYDDNNIEVIKKFNFLGFTILGSQRAPGGILTDVKEGIEGAHMLITDWFDNAPRFERNCKALAFAYNAYDKATNDNVENPESIDKDSNIFSKKEEDTEVENEKTETISLEDDNKKRGGEGMETKFEEKIDVNSEPNPIDTDDKSMAEIVDEATKSISAPESKLPEGASEDNENITLTEEVSKGPDGQEAEVVGKEDSEKKEDIVEQPDDEAKLDVGRESAFESEKEEDVNLENNNFTEEIKETEACENIEHEGCDCIEQEDCGCVEQEGCDCMEQEACDCMEQEGCDCMEQEACGDKLEEACGNNETFETEENSEESKEEFATGDDRLAAEIQNVLHSLVISEQEAIQEYNNAASFIREYFPKIADILMNIAQDETTHVGELEVALNTINDKTLENIEDGHNEAEEVISEAENGDEKDDVSGFSEKKFDDDDDDHHDDDIHDDDDDDHDDDHDDGHDDGHDDDIHDDDNDDDDHDDDDHDDDDDNREEFSENGDAKLEVAGQFFTVKELLESYASLKDKFETLSNSIKQKEAEALIAFGEEFVNADEYVDADSKAKYIAEIKDKCEKFELNSKEEVQNYAESVLAMYYYKNKIVVKENKEEADFSLNISSTNNGFVGNNRESASKLKEAINKLNHVK